MSFVSSVCLIYRAKVVDGADAKEEVVYGEIDLDEVDKVRTNIPISRQRQLLAYTTALPHPSV